MNLALTIVERIVATTFIFMWRGEFLRFFDHGVCFIMALDVSRELKSAAKIIDAIVAIAGEFIVYVARGIYVAMMLEERNVEDACVPSCEENIWRLSATLFAKIKDALAHIACRNFCFAIAASVDFLHVINSEFCFWFAIRVLKEIKIAAHDPFVAIPVHFEDCDLEHLFCFGVHTGGLDVEHEELVHVGPGGLR